MSFWSGPLLISLLGAAPSGARGAEAADYRRDIKPIFQERCTRCHGAAKQRSGLRLDTARNVLLGGNHGPAVVPGKSAESLLILAVTAVPGSGDLKPMPPAGERLGKEEVRLLRAWIDAGAPAPGDEKPEAAPAGAASHWAFRPLIRPEPPPVNDRAWPLNPIDAFILAKLEENGLRPSGEADRATLIRRLGLDLIGLPPSPAEVDAFEADSRDGACERLVERLLSSPHHGERWGRHWLDLARYADSNGYTIDGSRTIWKYRDWVIDALNRDLPFDRFAIEQLAGDLLPGATEEQVIATGFHRNTLKNEEGGTDPEQFRVEAVADRVSTTATVFLGLTLGCARCHDHKYDPVSQREFYQLFAFFNQAEERTLAVQADAKVQKEAPALRLELAQDEKRLVETEAASGGRQADWERRLAGRLEVAWEPLHPIEVRSEAGTSIARLDDRSLLVRGAIPERDRTTITAVLPHGGLTAIRLEALTHPSLPREGPGLAPNGNFVLSELRAEVGPPPVPGGPPPERAPVPLARAIADHSQEKHPVENAIDGDPKTGWAINVASGKLNLNRTAVFFPRQDLKPAPGSLLTVTLEQSHSAPRYLLGRFRLAVTGAAREAVELPEEVRRVLARPPAERGAEEKKLLFSEFKLRDPERLPLAARVEELRGRLKQIEESRTRTLVMEERKEPRLTHVHLRGDFLRPGARVEAGVPAALPALKARGATADRLDLARWLVDRRNPLTARVTVNRIWQAYFGQGLVATENDFGLQGSPPTHPELLDWLASAFIESGWSLKALHRLIATSRAYRQSSRWRPELAERDPANRLLARQARIRLEAETIRDAALAVSGLLAPEIGGPGVYPPQPDGVYRFTQNLKNWIESQGPDRYRRGLYTFFWRSSPHPFLTTFDAPDATVSCTRRPRSNTPLQALTLANDRAFLEAARALAGRILAEAPPADEARVRHGFRLAVARSPSAVESRRLHGFLQEERERFRAAGGEAAGLDPAGIAGLDPAEGAAWTALARVLLNLDEFITRE